MLTSEKKYHFPSSGSETLSHRPIVIGSGPAGLFCAWYLAKAGYCPLVLERGEEADKRQETVENFWKNGTWIRIPMYSSERAVQGLFPMES